ncbi:MAG TPA: 50S ribosomal protein L21e [Thermoplasmata archaeon]|jgi:large subunit ribosomal protein L21e|nr:50S ribosomal protein L21e [Thermoplasmata archaeon]HUS56403.1 50S ribosomal protein L21e [Thermoplasmata archaeon]
MVKASKGSRRRTRKVLQKRPRDRGLSPITRTFQTFEVGEKANVKIDPSIHKGMPHVRFHGSTGTIAGMQGGSYLVDVKDGNMAKQIIARPEHLRKAR